jgi:hypothetical protein
MNLFGFLSLVYSFSLKLLNLAYCLLSSTSCMDSGAISIVPEQFPNEDTVILEFEPSCKMILSSSFFFFYSSHNCEGRSFSWRLLLPAKTYNFLLFIWKMYNCIIHSKVHVMYICLNVFCIHCSLEFKMFCEILSWALHIWPGLVR